MKKIAVVTGANRGMGFETARQLAQLDMEVVLTSREAAAAREACVRLEAEGLTLVPFKLNITKPEDCAHLQGFLLKTYGRLDVLVNNAGAFFESTDQAARDSTSAFTTAPEVMRQSFELNTLGALNVVQALLPLMQANKSGRIVNVSTGMASLQTMTRGWPGYRVSKTALNALTRIMADELRETDIKINAVDPGWVRTDMGGPFAMRSVEEGVDTTIWLATLGTEGPSGEFFYNRNVAQW